MKYVLLFVDTPEFAAEFDAMGDEERGRAVQKVYEWLDTHSDKLRGGNKLRAPEDQFYGDRDGFIIDPFGHGWVVASHVEDVSQEEMGRRLAAMFGGSES